MLSFAKQGAAYPASLLREGAVGSVSDYIADGVARGRFRLSGARLDLTGNCSIVQNNGDTVYSGTLRLVQDGVSLTGTVDWGGQHPSGTVRGRIVGETVVFRVTYPSGSSDPYGNYSASISIATSELYNGTAVAASGAGARWAAKLKGR